MYVPVLLISVGPSSTVIDPSRETLQVEYEAVFSSVTSIAKKSPEAVVMLFAPKAFNRDGTVLSKRLLIELHLKVCSRRASNRH
jgi:hypothetical protein